jgi:4-alpha-glucanotransferase
MGRPGAHRAWCLPDAFNQAGKNWGLAPANPLILKKQSHLSFVASLPANMRHAGILRIDHVRSPDRIYWIPSGMEASAGETPISGSKW